MRWIKYWYRRITNHCTCCGNKIIKDSKYFRYPVYYYCHWCNKKRLHSLNYGMSGEQFKRMILQEKGRC